jgi:ABC-type multidrug transport system ATPase subunit
MWDNPTRGLDSKSAVEFARMLRREADRNDKTIVTTTYQAGNGIYDQFDKVLVLAEGRVTYYGSRRLARQYFEDLGFICPKGANIADFLTSVTVLTERTVRPGCEEKVPNTPEEFEYCYHNSAIYREQLSAIVPPEKLTYETEDLEMAVASEKGKQHIPRKTSPYTAKLWSQIGACTVRQFQIMWGDKFSLVSRDISMVARELVLTATSLDGQDLLCNHSGSCVW